jgi:hypothetical protein
MHQIEKYIMNSQTRIHQVFWTQNASGIPGFRIHQVFLDPEYIRYSWTQNTSGILEPRIHQVFLDPEYIRYSRTQNT